MNKLLLLGIAAALGAARLAFFPVNPPVELQPTSPGTAQTGHLNINGTATVGVLRSNNTVFGQSTAPTGFAYGGFFTAASNQARGFYGYASSPTGLTYGGFFQNASESGRAVYGLATSTTGFNYGGYFQSASSDGRGILGVAASATGTTYGVYGSAVSPDGYGVYSNGNMSASGVISGNGSGLTNLNASRLTTGTVGNNRLPLPMNLNGSESGSYVLGVQNDSPTNYSKAIYGASTATSGLTFGGRFENTSGSGSAVSGVNDADAGGIGGDFIAYGAPATAVRGQSLGLSGNGYGGYFTCQSPDGTALYASGAVKTGVYCQLYQTTGSSKAGYFVTQSDQGKSVYGWNFNSLATSTPYGVYGQANPATMGYGVFAIGDLGASGTKSFRIDHPSDPENKYLLHYSSESPFPQNFYNGNVQTDSQGYAWVELPGYFSEINANFKYQLTVISEEESFVQAMVSKRIQGNRFQVRTSAPNIEVSWMVFADRNDERIRFNRPTAVRMKSDSERGKYQHPEYFGLGAERGLEYDPKSAQAQGAARPTKPPQK